MPFPALKPQRHLFYDGLQFAGFAAVSAFGAEGFVHKGASEFGLADGVFGACPRAGHASAAKFLLDDELVEFHTVGFRGRAFDRSCRP